MSARNNWNKLAQLDRIRRQGAEPAKEQDHMVKLRQASKRRPMSKEDLRREADRLIAAAGGASAIKLQTERPAISNRNKQEEFEGFPAAQRPRIRPEWRGGVDIAVPPSLVIYADGCCEPNPGIGGWGFVVYRDGAEVHCASGGDLDSTNQRAELKAALRALVWAKANVADESIRLLSDSRYTVTGCNDWRHKWKGLGWRRKSAKAAEKNQVIANLDLWKELDAALVAMPLKLEWVKGHAGIAGNERADELSNIGRQKAVGPA
ncbi:ribonuclease HI [Mesorhizobium sp. M1300]|uniref:ribonuclease H family protein n=1 Tax=Mesorhizobium sp. M1300 TaxID=2957077 RepID=UPI00333CD336